jgi:hypothetical protein
LAVSAGEEFGTGDLTNIDGSIFRKKEKSMLKRAAIIFGVAFIAAGILGFVPGATTEDGRLLGLFEVNTLHNIVHLLSGAVALFAGYQSDNASRLYFQIFGVVYAFVAVIGLFSGDRAILGMAHNTADAVLHVVIAAVALYLGFGLRRRHERHVTA